MSLHYLMNGRHVTYRDEREPSLLMLGFSSDYFPSLFQSLFPFQSSYSSP